MQVCVALKITFCPQILEEREGEKIFHNFFQEAFNTIDFDSKGTDCLSKDEQKKLTQFRPPLCSWPQSIEILGKYNIIQHKQSYCNPVYW